MYVCLFIIHTCVGVCLYVYHSHNISIGVCLSFTRSPMLVMAAPNIIQYPSQGSIVSPIEREVVGGHISGRERGGSGSDERMG